VAHVLVRNACTSVWIERDNNEIKEHYTSRKKIRNRKNKKTTKKKKKRTGVDEERTASLDDLAEVQAKWRLAVPKGWDRQLVVARHAVV
jgi:hypothetical protein